MREEITTSCRSVDTRYTRLNLLGWALLCPYAKDLLWHGAIPMEGPVYPTAEESKRIHDRFKRVVSDVVRDALGSNLIGVEAEYDHRICFLRDGEVLCADSRADYIYIAKLNNVLAVLYLEVSSTRINVVKPWQALLRGLAIYYELRRPVGIVIVSPQRIMYKLLSEEDQGSILKRMRRSSGDFKPTPDLCSLCELLHLCPYKVI